MEVDVSVDVNKRVVRYEHEVFVSRNWSFLHVAKQDYGCSVLVGEVKFSLVSVCRRVTLYCDHAYGFAPIFFCRLHVL